MKLLSKNEKICKIKIWAPRILFVVYLAIVLRITVFRSDFSFQNFLSGGSINLKLLTGYAELVMGGHWWMFCYLFFGNIIWFVPLGMYLEMIGRTKRLWQAALIGFLFSLCIETLQYLFGTGYSELDDLLLNTLGVWVGAVGMRAIKRCKLYESLFTIADNSVMIERGKGGK